MIRDELKEEVRQRLAFDAASGPGAAERVYGEELARKLAQFEDLAAEFQADGRKLPGNLLRKLGKMKLNGLSATEKLAALHAAAGRAPTLVPTTPAPASSPVAVRNIPPARPAVPAAAGGENGVVWSFGALTSLVDGVFGTGACRSILAEPIVGVSDPSAATPVEHSAAAWDERAETIRRAAAARDRDRNSAAGQAQAAGKLRGALWKAGVELPGLYAGFSPSDDDRRRAEKKPHRIAAAQRNAADWLAAFQQTPSGTRLTSRAAAAARAFLEASAR